MKIEDFQPGKFRQQYQYRSFSPGATLADAVFIPPPHDEVPRLMGDLEAFFTGGNHLTPPSASTA